MSTYAGVDIAKRSFCVCFGDAESVVEFAMEATSRRSFVRRVMALQNPHVIVEATGGYEKSVVEALVKAKVDVTVLNPRRARDFAKATGQLAKTDAIDARVLMQFGERLQPDANGEQHMRYEPMRRLAARRRQLIQMQVQEKNRLEHADTFLRKCIRSMLRHIEKQVVLLDKELEALIEADDAMAQHRKQLVSVPGIGDLTACQLLAYLPELGHATRREIASLAGLAPKNRDSGTFRGKRMIGGGRSAVRHILYMPTLVAIQHNQPIREYYQRLIAKGKPKMTALTAAMRKLLTILNTMLQNNDFWRKPLDIR